MHRGSDAGSLSVVFYANPSQVLKNGLFFSVKYFLQYSKLCVKAKPIGMKEEFTDSSELLYRGQTGSLWKIESSIERRGIEEIRYKTYYSHNDKLKPLINPLIKNKFIRKRRLHDIHLNLMSLNRDHGLCPKWSI